MIYKLSFSILICIALSFCEGVKQASPAIANYDILPEPQYIKQSDDFFLLNSSTQIIAKSSLDQESNLLKEFINQLPSKATTSNEIKLVLTEDSSAQKEAYSLVVSEKQIILKANNSEGISRGIATIKQLSLLNKHHENFYIPSVEIMDSSRFEHRGLLLDCSRHFFSKEVVMKYIDLLSLYKMNTLHWHLTEDQGWRIAIDKYPKLTSVAAYRTELNGELYGGFYSKEDIREIVAYAEKRHINIIPEIELPGHSQAAIAAYPHLSCTAEQVDVANDWGVFKEIYCTGNDSVFIFLKDVLSEVMDLFPSNYIHIGGDEAPKTRWKECDKCQKRIKEEGLANEEELQSYFIKRIQQFLNANGKTLIGWDEILEGGLAEGAIVQSWRGMQGGVEAANHGNRAIMSPTSHAYLDYDLKAIDLEKVYSFNPIPKELDDDKASLILGGECNMWTEHVPDEKTLDRKVFPRLLAMSEVLWTGPQINSYDSFLSRLQSNYTILNHYRVNYGEEGLPYEFELDPSIPSIQLIPASSVSLDYRFLCKNCDTLFQPYEKPIVIKQSSILEIKSKKNGKAYGEVGTIPFSIHKAINKKVTYQSEYSNWYTAGGDKGLVDSKLGSLDFRDGAWQGFWGEDLECVVVLDSIQTISSVSANFYQYNNSWIFAPTNFIVSISTDSKHWKEFGEYKGNVDPKKRGKFITSYHITNEDQIAKYIKVEVENLGTVPEWHEAAGSDAWIFIDEIIVE